MGRNRAKSRELNNIQFKIKGNSLIEFVQFVSVLVFLIKIGLQTVVRDLLCSNLNSFGRLG